MNRRGFFGLLAGTAAAKTVKAEDVDGLASKILPFDEWDMPTAERAEIFTHTEGYTVAATLDGKPYIKSYSPTEKGRKL